MLQSSLPAYLKTPVLQTGSRITSHIYWLREWESHPPEEVYEASLCTLVEFPAMKLARQAEALAKVGGIGG